MPKRRRSKKKTEPEINVGGDTKLPISEVEKIVRSYTGEGDENKWNVRVIT